MDTIVFQSPDVSIGQFRCNVGDPRFRDTGPIERAIVVFPRTSVWIHHEGKRGFVADPNVATIYNRGQRYERYAISRDGDHCDWFSLSDELAFEIAFAIDPRGASPERPFASARAQSPTALYARQRAVLRRARAGLLARLEAEEEVLGIVASVLSHGETRADVRIRKQRASLLRRRELAEAARAEIARTAAENRSVAELAKALATSPFHLCRVFREHTGLTMHAYRIRLRLRIAIEQLTAFTNHRTGNLSTIAHEAGFSSHAHFVHICRRELGITPTELRSQLG